jgi:hypothetical protein
MFPHDSASLARARLSFVQGLVPRQSENFLSPAYLTTDRPPTPTALCQAATRIPRFQSPRAVLNSAMKLKQGQVWKRESDYLLIVRWERLAIEYKQMADLRTREGTSHEVTKKEFCRLIKDATLLDPAKKR